MTVESDDAVLAEGYGDLSVGGGEERAKGVRRLMSNGRQLWDD